jgi:hypothetical protein
MEKNHKPYKFMVLDKKDKWSEWTGMFETKEEAMKWFNKHGKFHLDNGHILGLFKNRFLIMNYDILIKWMNENID